MRARRLAFGAVRVDDLWVRELPGLSSLASGALAAIVSRAAQATTGWVRALGRRRVERVARDE